VILVYIMISSVISSSIHSYIDSFNQSYNYSFIYSVIHAYYSFIHLPISPVGWVHLVGGPVDLQGGPIFFYMVPHYIRYKSRGGQQGRPGPRPPPDATGLLSIHPFTHCMTIVKWIRYYRCSFHLRDASTHS